MDAVDELCGEITGTRGLTNGVSKGMLVSISQLTICPGCAQSLSGSKPDGTGREGAVREGKKREYSVAAVGVPSSAFVVHEGYPRDGRVISDVPSLTGCRADVYSNLEDVSARSMV